MMRQSFKISLLLILVVASASAKKRADPEMALMEISENFDRAMLPVMYWENGHPEHWGIIGSAFLINTDGYFITAAHVLKFYKKDSAELSVVLRQEDENGGGRDFDIIEKDDNHDLALCKIRKFSIQKSAHEVQPSEVPISTLQISEEPAKQGQFVAISGFPLGSFNPSVQFGTIAAAEIISPYPYILGVPAGKRFLLQVSVSGNHGNSGGPVISLSTGEVVGIIDQYIPAPTLIPSLPEEKQDTVLQQSGIMLALPSIWVQELLKRNHVSSEQHKANEGLKILRLSH